MKKNTIPEPRSRFILVRCECKKEQIVYSHTTSEIKCEVCEKVLVKSTGGKAEILGEVLQVLG